MTCIVSACVCKGWLARVSCPQGPGHGYPPLRILMGSSASLVYELDSLWSRSLYRWLNVQMFSIVSVHIADYGCSKWFQLLERALEASGDDLDDAIKSLKELHLMESNQANLSATGSTFENGPSVVQPSVEGSFSSKSYSIPRVHSSNFQHCASSCICPSCTNHTHRTVQ